MLHVAAGAMFAIAGVGIVACNRHQALRESGTEQKVAQDGRDQSRTRVGAGGAGIAVRKLEPAVKSENPPSENLHDGPFRVGGDVTAPRVIKRVDPQYPELTGRYALGILILECVITRRGTVRNVKVLKGPDNAFTKATIAALEQWRFEPGLRKGEPVEVIFNLTVNHVPYEGVPYSLP